MYSHIPACIVSCASASPTLVADSHTNMELTTSNDVIFCSSGHLYSAMEDTLQRQTSENVREGSSLPGSPGRGVGGADPRLTNGEASESSVHRIPPQVALKQSISAGEPADLVQGGALESSAPVNGLPDVEQTNGEENRSTKVRLLMIGVEGTNS